MGEGAAWQLRPVLVVPVPLARALIVVATGIGVIRARQFTVGASLQQSPVAGLARPTAGDIDRAAEIARLLGELAQRHGAMAAAVRGHDAVGGDALYY